MKIAFCSIFFIAVLFGSAISQESITSDNLDDARDALESKRKAFQQLSDNEKSQISRLHDLEEQLALSGQLLVKIKREIARLNSSITQKETDLVISKQTKIHKKEVLGRRMNYIYKIGNKPEWISFVKAANPTEAVTALRNMKLILDFDKKLIRSYNELSANIADNIIKLQRDKNILNNLSQDYQDEVKIRESALGARKKLLKKARKSKAELEKAMDDLLSDYPKIENIFEELQDSDMKTEESSRLPGLNDKKGNLIWPVTGKIVKRFGTIEDDRGIKLSNPGIDIKTSLGKQVKAASKGEVIYVSWLRGYGQFLIINHGSGYFTLYSNLSEIYVDNGDSVIAGEAIAAAGDSKYFDYPTVHFELRHKKEQYNPVDWLR
jgi:septal ring factor EnvC (AmiA/AmiB activator)